MIEDRPETCAALRDGLPCGAPPLGERALSLHRGNQGTFYRIHGAIDAASIGQATSAGCIRLFNQGAIDLEQRVRSGTQVMVEQRKAGKGAVLPETRRRLQQIFPPTHR